MKRLTLVILLLCTCSVVTGADRFPLPEFGQDYSLPVESKPDPWGKTFEITAFVLLAAGLGLAAWLVHRRRRRWAVVVMLLGTLVFFGFLRQGCVCSVGSVQNVCYGLGGWGYAVPWVVLGFFVLPLVAALVFGRVFCGTLCPLGAVQDVLLWKPVRVPAALEHGLRLVPWAYLGLAVLLAVTASDFIICRYDPFVALFRFTGPLTIVLLAVGLLALGLFVGRPYCRFLCPYGALLGLCSRVAWKQVSTTPDDCINCRLCEDACPFGAIRGPNESQELDKDRARRRLLWVLAGWPVMVALGVLVGWFVAPALAQLNPTIRQARDVQVYRTQVQDFTAGRASRPEVPDTVRGYQATRQPPEALLERADAIRQTMTTGAMLLGGSLGVIVGAGLLSASLHRTRTDYRPDPARCVACTRCYTYCPRQRAVDNPQDRTDS